MHFENLYRESLMKERSVILTKIGRISFLESGIIRIHGNSDITITLEDMYENDRVFRKLIPSGNAPFLTIFGENAIIETDAQAYFSNKERSKVKRAEALITTQTHHKLIALTHLVTSRPEYPSQHFASEEKGLEWLLAFVDKT